MNMVHFKRQSLVGAGLWLCVALMFSCTHAPKQEREPMAALGCFGSVFLKDGRLAKLTMRELKPISIPWTVVQIREAVMSPDFSVLAILAESGTPTNPRSDLLFYECDTSTWHKPHVSENNVTFSHIAWKPDSNQVAYLARRIKHTRAMGQNWHQFVENVESVLWPSFEKREHLTLKSELRPGVGLLSDAVSHNLSRVRSFQFHPTEALMVFETVPKHRVHLREFRILNLAKATPEYPVDYTPWFEVIDVQEPKLFLTQAGGVVLRRMRGAWTYSTLSLGKSTFTPLKVSELITGEGVRALFLRDSTLYLEMKTTTRAHLYGLIIPPEEFPQIPQRRELASVILENLFTFEGEDATAANFDLAMNRVLYACRSKLTTLSRVCISSLSAGPVKHPAVLASNTSSVYPILTYWPH